MTTKTTTTCDHCGKEQTDAQFLEVSTRGCRLITTAHLCDFECMAAWAPRAAQRDEERTRNILRAFGKPGATIPWRE